jgi:hypothetical protein
MTFEGNPLWLIGIVLVVVYSLYWLVKVCFHLEDQDARNGRRDLDDDGHMPFH